MEEFIEDLVKGLKLGPWMFILFGVVCAVFLFGIIMMIIKKKAFHVGTSTAVATLLAAVAMSYIGQIWGDAIWVKFNLFIIGSGAILSLIGGFIAMIVSKKRKKKCECSHEHHTDSMPEPATDYFNEPAPFDYSNDNTYAAPAPAPSPMPTYGAPAASPYANAYAAPAPAVQSGYGTASPEVEALLAKINRICVSGAPLPEMRETAMQLQKERAKPENKNNPDTYSKLNKALLDLLNVIQKK